MQIYPSALQGQLTPLKPVYLIFGDEHFLVNDCHQQIVSQAKAQGYEERIQFTLEANFNWQSVFDEWQALSLFANRRIFEIDMRNAKLGKEGSAAIIELMAQANPDNLLIIIGPKLTKSEQNAKWFKTLEPLGLFIPCYTPEGQQFSRWIQTRLQHYQLTLSSDAVELLAALYVGNLVSLDQSLKLLQLMNYQGQIGSEQIAAWLESQTNYSAFDLVEYALKGDLEAVTTCLKQLQLDDTPIQMVFWAVNQEISKLHALKQAQAQGNLNAALWRKHAVWPQRQNLYNQALAKLSLTDINKLNSQCMALEHRLKFEGNQDWLAICRICFGLTPSSSAILLLD